MPVRPSHLLAILGTASAVTTLTPDEALACQSSQLVMTSVAFVDGLWEYRRELCVGGGRVGTLPGAEAPTRTFAIAVTGPGKLQSFEPSTLVGTYTGGTLFGYAEAVQGPFVLPVFATLPACPDPNTAGARCQHPTTSLLVYFNEDGAPPYTCIDSTAGCGLPHSECTELTLRFDDRIDALRVLGLEGDGNPFAGCTSNPDMLFLSGADQDGDGFFDSSDRCPGADDLIDLDGDLVPECLDQVDADLDGVNDTHDASACPISGPDADTDGIPDACDLCPLDPHNDSDLDGLCDADDPCPFLANTVPQADGRCGQFAGCGIKTATAQRTAVGWQVEAEVCVRPPRATYQNTVNLALAVYGDTLEIETFSPPTLTFFGIGLEAGVVLSPLDFGGPALFGERASTCTRYVGTGEPCQDLGAPPEAILLYGAPADPPFGIVGNAILPPQCHVVSLTTSSRPTQLTAHGLEAAGDLYAGCLAGPFADIVPTLLAEADSDADGVPDSADRCPGFDDRLDADDDGAPDACDPCPLDEADDSDGDGRCGDVDLCPGHDDFQDGDGDGVADGCDACPVDFFNDSDGDAACDSDDPCPLDALNDQDGDGVCDSLDQCPFDALDDEDGDGLCGDADPCPQDVVNDADGDGICELTDNCPVTANADQSDRDGDGIGDACEPDADGDGVIDDVDNCPLAFNPGQADADQDGAGDACDAIDPDSDDDGVDDVVDACPATMMSAPVDNTGCSQAQLCPTDAQWKNHGAYVLCVTRATLRLRAAGAITWLQALRAIAAAVCSDVGKRR